MIQFVGSVDGSHERQDFIVFGIGWAEIIVISLVLLIFVGPKNLPGMLKKMGHLMAEFRSASRELRNQIEVEVERIPNPASMVRETVDELGKSLPSPYKEFEAEIEDINDIKEAVYSDDRPSPYANEEKAPAIDPETSENLGFSGVKVPYDSPEESPVKMNEEPASDSSDNASPQAQESAQKRPDKSTKNSDLDEDAS